jgi:hypothetical protein
MGRTSIVQPGCTKAREMPKDVFRREVERELTGEDKEPWERKRLFKHRFQCSAPGSYCYQRPDGRSGADSQVSLLFF